MNKKIEKKIIKKKNKIKKLKNLKKKPKKKLKKKKKLELCGLEEKKIKLNPLVGELGIAKYFFTHSSG